MQNDLYLNATTQTFLDQFEYDYGVELFGKETDEPETVEAACTWNGHSVGYAYREINRITFAVTGFLWRHPGSAIISGTFPKPITALEFINDAHGDELESEDFVKEIRAAIVAKCGRISGLADCGLI